MKLEFKFLPTAALGLALLTSCATTTFVVPKIGTRFEDHKKKLTYDTALDMYVVPLEKYETLEYEKFDVIIPNDEVVQYYAPASKNSSNNAEFAVRNLPPETDFFARAVYSQVREEWSSLSDIKQSYEDKFTSNKSTISHKTGITKHDGFNCVEYDVVARLAEPGKVIAVHGFSMFDPNNPGYFFEVVAGRTAYQQQIDDDFLIRASGIFFESVKFRP